MNLLKNLKDIRKNAITPTENEIKFMFEAIYSMLEIQAESGYAHMVLDDSIIVECVGFNVRESSFENTKQECLNRLAEEGLNIIFRRNNNIFEIKWDEVSI